MQSHEYIQYIYYLLPFLPYIPLRAHLCLFSLQVLGELLHPWQEVSALHIWPQNLRNDDTLRSSLPLAPTGVVIAEGLTSGV